MSYTNGDDPCLDAEIEGRKAFNAGQSRETCPYRRGSLKIKWLDGFDDEAKFQAARREAAQEAMDRDQMRRIRVFAIYLSPEDGRTARTVTATGFASAADALAHLTTEAEANGFTICASTEDGAIDVFAYKGNLANIYAIEAA